MPELDFLEIMGCAKTLDLSTGTGDQPMDCACYAQTDNLIIAVRGSRVYKCNPTTGAVISSADYSQLALGGATICYDSGVNRCFAACWNQSHVDFVNFRQARNIYRIVPSTIATDMVADQGTIFSGLVFGIPGAGTALEAGIVALRSGGGNIYALAYFGNTSNPSLNYIRFPATNWAAGAVANAVGGNSSSFSLAQGVRSGQDTVWSAFPAFGNYFDFNFTSSISGGNAGSFLINCVEYAPVQDRVYCPHEFQFINVFNAATETHTVTIDTGRSTFNGVNIRRNPNDGLLYIAGGTDNTVCVLDPTSNGFTIKSGFDLPWDFVFTPTKKFAVQQGSTGLKEIV